MSYQGAFDVTKMCAIGRTPGSSSSGPAGTPTRPFHAWPLGTTVPQRAQKGLGLPGVDSYCATLASPRVKRNPSAGPKTAVENALPCALRQRPQWQCDMNCSGGAISHATSPQRQLPRTVDMETSLAPRDGWVNAAGASGYAPP